MKSVLLNKQGFHYFMIKPSKQMKLSQLIQGFPFLNSKGSLDLNISSIAYDSRKVEPESLFVAIPGHNHDGSQFIEEAGQKGASAFITEISKPNFQEFEFGSDKLTGIQVEDSRHALAWVSSQFFNEPSQHLKLTGITGTNGKTTITYLLESIFKAHGEEYGVIGSIEYRYGNKNISSPMTTPESLEINSFLAKMVAENISHCCMEVSSHSLALKRVRELNFAVGVFTNLTRDHLDYHQTQEHYKNAKKSLFKDCNVQKQVINIDDPVGREIVFETNVSTLTTGLKEKADVTAEGYALSEEGIRFILKSPSGSQAILSPLLGWHNLNNILSASAVALHYNIPLDVIAEGIRNLNKVPGRFEKIDSGQDFVVAVDYAHTDDALSNALKAARNLTRNQLVVVFGCGGDRDPGKRKLMGEVALRLSDYAIITSDNPRTEDPSQIIEHICEGLPKNAENGTHYSIIPSREKAIEEAINMANSGDFVLIAGKGHEDYQIIGKEKIHFDDREEAARALDKRLSFNE